MKKALIFFLLLTVSGFLIQARALFAQTKGELRMGSTAIHSDLALYGRLYKPDIAIIILSGNRDPRDAAQMVRLLRTDNPNLKTVFPHHHRLKPAKGAATPEQMEAEIKKLKLPVKFINPELGKVYTFTKE